MPRDEFVAVFGRLYDDMRADSRLASDAFAAAVTARMGGTFTISAPSAPAKRPIPEAGYRSEQFRAISS